MFLGEYGFFIAVNSSNPENDGDVEDNQADIRIPLTVTTDWKVLGSSEPASLEYNISDPFPDKYLVEDQIGKKICLKKIRTVHFKIPDRVLTRC